MAVVHFRPPIELGMFSMHQISLVKKEQCQCNFFVVLIFISLTPRIVVIRVESSDYTYVLNNIQNSSTLLCKSIDTDERWCFFSSSFPYIFK